MKATSDDSVTRFRASSSTVVIALLVAVLLGSNAWWAYQALDTGVTLSYMEVSLKDYREALRQALAVLPVAARRDSTRAQVISAARASAEHDDVFEKEGFIWVGRLGLRFTDDGRLASARTSWEPF